MVGGSGHNNNITKVEVSMNLRELGFEIVVDTTTKQEYTRHSARRLCMYLYICICSYMYGWGCAKPCATLCARPCVTFPRASFLLLHIYGWASVLRLRLIFVLFLPFPFSPLLYLTCPTHSFPIPTENNTHTNHTSVTQAHDDSKNVARE